MSTKVIRDVRDLPDWFDIKKYAGARDLTLDDWEHNLIERLMAKAFCAPRGIYANPLRRRAAKLVFGDGVHHTVESSEKPGMEEVTNSWSSVKVNMAATDEQIKADFDKWLKASRKDAEVKMRSKNYTDNDARKWHQAGVLPYLDLTLWARLEDVTITQHVLGRAIFPNGVGDPTERIRRTTKPTAERLLTPQALLEFGAK